MHLEFPTFFFCFTEDKYIFVHNALWDSCKVLHSYSIFIVHLIFAYCNKSNNNIYQQYRQCKYKNNISVKVFLINSTLLFCLYTHGPTENISSNLYVHRLYVYPFHSLRYSYLQRSEINLIPKSRYMSAHTKIQYKLSTAEC